MGLEATGTDKARCVRVYDRTYPETQAREHQISGISNAIYPSSGHGKENEKGHYISREGAVPGGNRVGVGYGNEPYQEASRGHHTGRDTGAATITRGIIKALGGLGSDSLSSGEKRDHNTMIDFPAVVTPFAKTKKRDDDTIQTNSEKKGRGLPKGSKNKVRVSLSPSSKAAN